MARRRKNLTDQRLEEEKMDTINRLLKRQAPKMRGKGAAGGKSAGDATPALGDAGDGTAAGGALATIEEAPKPTMVRWVSSKDGVRVYVPASWIGTPAGAVFEKGMGGKMGQGRKLIEVVDEGGDVVMAGA